MDYEKAYVDALERAKKGLPMDEVFPELKETEDERIRKNCIHFLELQKAHHAGTSEIDECIAYLEKQKEFQFGYPGIYFYDGKRLHFQGNPAMEENPYDFAMSQQEEQNPAEWSDSVAKEMFIKALERAVEQTKKGYELTDFDKHSWWEDFKAYSEIKPEWSEEDETRLKVIKKELERFIMFEQYGTPLSVDDIDWLESLPERFAIQPKQEWDEEDVEKLAKK